MNDFVDLVVELFDGEIIGVVSPVEKKESNGGGDKVSPAVDSLPPLDENAKLAFVIDATNYVHTFYAATNGNSSLTASSAFAEMIQAFRAKYKPDFVAAVFDGEGDTFRHRLFDGYKGSRSPKEESLLDQIQAAKDMAEEMEGVRVIKIHGVEADDCIGTLVSRSVVDGWKAVVMTRDRDCDQLLRDGRVSILRRATRKAGLWAFKFYSESDLIEETGVKPKLWAAYRGLSGDSSDEWGGCEGVGEKTAKLLLDRYGGSGGSLAALRSIKQAMQCEKKPEGVGQKQWESLKSFDYELAFQISSLNCKIAIQ